MQLKRTFALTGLLAGGVLATASVPAQAFSFTTNANFANAPKGDIWLQSITHTGGQVVDQFSLINRADIIHNDDINPADPGYYYDAEGGASSDKGDDVFGGASVADPTNADIVTSLGNKNLNSIIDTEDGQNYSERRGNFEMNLFFESAVNQIYFWERGMNSVLGVQAIDKDGNILGNFLEIGAAKGTTSSYDPGTHAWTSAGFSIDTKEIKGSNAPQEVGALGLFLSDFGVGSKIAGLKVTSISPDYNGPDFKIIGADVSVPEPASVAGLIMVGGAMVASRRRKQRQA